MSTFPPRECGIATFTKDLTTAMDKKFSPYIKSKILAMNSSQTSIYNYPMNVIFEINDNDISSYIDVARWVNKIDAIKLINIQHEFGIFGGVYTNYLIAFLDIVEKPIVITFHTIFPNPDDKLKKKVRNIAEKSTCLVVMTNKGNKILREDYEIKKKISVIPHGIPTIPFNPSIKRKTIKGIKEKIILSSFGLMHSGKGYEYVIEALPKVVKKFPNLLYLIIGETHPEIRRKEGEKYRNFLEEKVKELGLQKYVKFYNRYLSLKEIIISKGN